MSEYRAFVLGRVGQILRRYDYKATSDAAAVEHAKQYLRESSVEIWQGERFVHLLEPRDPR